ncbi:MAG: UPF0175 family protein [Bacteroidota bacterium]
MTIEIADELLRQTRLSEEELKLELAIRLFEIERLSFGQARKLAGLHVIAFQQALAKQRISLHYEVEEFEQDLGKSLS